MTALTFNLRSKAQHEAARNQHIRLMRYSAVRDAHVPGVVSWDRAYERAADALENTEAKAEPTTKELLPRRARQHRAAQGLGDAADPCSASPR